MSNTIRAAIIPAADNLPVLVMDLANDFEALQNRVGGWIEAVGTGDVAIYLDEEGKLAGKAPNARATGLARDLRVGLKATDIIVGDVVVTGFDDDTGENVDVPESVTEMVAPFVQA